MGTLRLLLAVLVVVEHLTEGLKATSHAGVFAVFGFYVISGYLITYILNDVYRFEARAFWVNRLLRIFPIYYVIALATLAVVMAYPIAARFHFAWMVQPVPMDTLGNLLIFPFEFYNPSYRLVPPTWSIAVELVNYFLLWLVVARSRNMALIAILVSAAFHLVSLGMGEDWHFRYKPFYAALLPFSMGSFIYFLRKARPALAAGIAPQWTLVAAIAWLANLVVAGWRMESAAHTLPGFSTTT